MSSLTTAGWLSLVVFGYLRRFKSKLYYYHIPDVITEVIIAFATDFFTWHTKQHGYGYHCFENDSLKIEKAEECYAFLLSSNILSLDICQQFEWEITIIESKVNKHSSLALMIGFIAYPMKDKTREWFDWNTFFGADNQFGIQAYSGHSCFTKYGRDGYELFAEQNENYEIKNGDRFCIRFDFRKRKCSFGYNGKFTADVYIDIPVDIIPAVCIYDPMIFACTKWNAIFKDNNI